MESERANAQIRLAIVIAFGTLVRLAGLGHHELWLDEILRVLWAIEPDRNLWEQATVGHAGSVFTTLWTGLVWHSTHSFALLRLAQAFCSIACIPLSYVLARKFTDERGSTGVAALVAIAPMQVAIARQAEEYGFLVLFMLLATLLLVRVFETRSVSPWDAALAGAISAAGFLCGGYMILPGLLALALSCVWLLRRELKGRDFALLALSQLPMVALFGYSLTFWAFSPRPEVRAYLDFMRGWVQMGSPRLPTSVLADLFFYGQLWGWGGYLGPWVYSLEALVALGIIAILWRGHRSLTRLGALGAFPALTLVLLFAVNAAIFLKYSGIPVYYSRIYAGGTFLLFILFVEGLRAGLREIRYIVLVSFVAVMLTSLLAIKLETHPARPLWFRNSVQNIDALTDVREIWVHPGELADLLRLETRGADLEFRGVWKDSFATPEATIGLDDAMSDEEAAQWAPRIAESGGCLLVVPYFIEMRDAARVLDSMLKDEYGYEQPAGAGKIPLYCPKDGKR